MKGLTVGGTKPVLLARLRASNEVVSEDEDSEDGVNESTELQQEEVGKRARQRVGQRAVTRMVKRTSAQVELEGLEGSCEPNVRPPWPRLLRWLLRVADE